MRRDLPSALLAACALISACSAPAERPASTPRNPAGYSPPTRPVTPAAPRPQAQIMQLPGLEGVIGANAAALLGLFGAPRIDLAEGDVRKLQFGGEACVLDIYLYPPENGGELRATHVDARRASDGQDVDRAACIEALRQR